MSTTAERVAQISDWIDGSPGYVGVDQEARLWRRVTKVASEAAEAIDALAGMTGENPRKGVTHTQADVEYELLDAALAALGALHSITGEDVMQRLAAHVQHVWRRAGLDKDER